MDKKRNNAAHLKSQGTKQAPKKRLAAPFALVTMLVAAVIGAGAALPRLAQGADSGDVSQGVIEKVADAPSDYGTHMSEPDDTSEIGRIKTDKTVRQVGFDGINRDTGDPVNPQQIGDNFTVTFSALSSGGTIAGESPVPSDVVLILDTSTSMGRAAGTSSTQRAEAMVDAVNETIAELVRVNPDNRIAAVAFGNSAQTLFPLQTLDPVADNQYFTLDNTEVGNFSNTITPDSSISGSNAVAFTGGTNTEAGLYFGMNILANADPKVTVGGVEYDRVPAVILISDGAAADLVQNANWWNLSASDSTVHGATISSDDRRVAIWFAPELVGSYMKNKVNANYGENDCFVATVGFNLSNSASAAERAIGNIVLNPKDYVGTDGTIDYPYGSLTASAANAYKNAYTALMVNHQSTTLRWNGAGNTQTFNYPSGDAAQYMPSDFKYNDVYIDVNDADELADQLMQTIETISSKAYAPTSTTDATGETTGYITFTDTIGDLMEVKGFNSILWVDHDPSSPTYGTETEYSNVSKTTSGSKDIYVFDDAVKSSWLFNYENTNLNRIILEVDKSGANEVVTIKIPPALLPMVDYEVTKTSSGIIATRNEETRPIKINYIVGPKQGVVEYIAGDTAAISDAALKAQVDAYVADSSHTVTVNGKTGVALYTNTWSGADEAVVPVAEFGINALNSYYSFAARTPLYTDENCTTPATSFTAGTTYYYPISVYHIDNDTEEVVHKSISSLNASDVEVVGGALYAKAGAQKELPAQTAKGTNATQTRAYQLRSHWQNGTTVHQHQGNNGRLVIETPGKLQLDKTIVLDENIPSSATIDEAAMNAKEFTFTLNFVKSSTDSTPLAGSYNYTITNPNKADRTGTIANGGTVKLTEDDTLLVNGLPSGAKYTISETDIPTGYSVKSSTTTYGQNTATGTGTTGKLSGEIVSGATATAEFTNEYSFDDNPQELSGRPHVKKTLEGRTISNTDEFIVNITQYSSNPAGGATVTNPVITVSRNAEGATVIDDYNIDAVCQGITFTAPGVYRFRIAEQNNAIPGITYSQSVYAYVVTVHDNGDGTMSINTDLSSANPDIYMEKTINMDGSSVPAGEGAVEPVTLPGGGMVLEATFTNTYSVSEVTIGATGMKNYTDNSGAKPLTADMFQFELRPSFYDANGDVLDQATVDAVPMPDGSTPSSANQDADTGLYYSKKDTFNSAAGDFGFGTITYGLGDVGNSYRYVAQEIIPADALASGMRHYVNRADSEDTVDTTDDHGYLWHDGSEIYDLKTITYQGMVYDCSRHVVVVVVSTEDEAGETHIKADVQFQTEASGQAGEVVITNTYEPAPVVTDDSDTATSISVTKQLVGRDLLDGETFTFTLVPSGANAINAVNNGNIVMPETGNKATATVSSLDANRQGSATFDGIVFKRVGSYTFSITENAGSAEATEYDPHTCNVTVTVIDNEDGTLGIGGITYNGSQTFTNTYTPDEVHYGAMGGVQIEKKVDGRAMVANKYSFTITAADDNARAKTPEPVTVRNASAAPDGIESGTQALVGLSFSRDDIGKTFTYTVTENVPEGATEVSEGIYRYEGITYASDGKREQTVTFTVTDDGENNLTVTATCGDESTVSTAELAYPVPVHFVNTYDFEPLVYQSTTFYKTIEGRDWKEGDEFSFTIAGSEGAPLPMVEGEENTTASVAYGDQTGTTAQFQFGDATFTKPGTYTYTITETAPADEDAATEGVQKEGLTYDTTPHTIQVVVTDNGNGTLSARTSAAAAERTFTNVYHASMDFEGEGVAVVDVAKTLIGRSMRDREFMADVIAVDTLDGEEPAEGYATAQQTAERFGQRVREYVPFSKPASGATSTGAAVPGIKFTEQDVGTTYAFEIREFVPSEAEDAQLDGVTYPMRDGVYYKTGETPDHYRAEVKVEDNGNGTLKVTTTLIAHDAEHQQIGEPIEVVNDGTIAETTPTAPFENTYDAAGEATINAVKDLEGRDWTDDDEFEFVIEPMKLEGGQLVEYAEGEVPANYPLPDYNLIATSQTEAVGSDGIAQGAHDGTSGWAISFTENMLTEDTDGVMKGDFYYRIREIGADGQPGTGGTADGVRYSTTPRYVHVHVQDLRTGALTTDVNYVTAEAPNTDIGTAPVFTNYYTASGEFAIPLTKNVIGRSTWTDADSYTFKLWPQTAGTDPMPADPAHEGQQLAEEILTIDKDTPNHSVSFSTITFTEPGTYTYYITEQKNTTVPGVEFDEFDERRVVIEVADNGNGELRIENVTYYTDLPMNGDLQPDVQDRAVFNNKYAATGTFEIPVTKEITGRVFRTGGVYTFTISGPANAPLPAQPTVSVEPTPGTTSSTFNFGEIEFTQDHLSMSPIIYTIVEVPGDADAVTYDTHEEKVSVALVDNGNGTITATPTILNDGTGDDTPNETKFINDYAATGTAEINVIKNFQGRGEDWLASDTFQFTITPVKLEGGQYVEYAAGEATPWMPSTTTAIASKQSESVTTNEYFAAPAWTMSFQANKDRQDLTYNSTLGRMTGDFYFKIEEVVPTTPATGITYDTNPRYAHVHAEDDRHGGILTHVYYDEATPGDPSTAKSATPVFKNTYESPKASLTVSKTWNDNNNQDGKRTDAVLHLFRQTASGLVQVEVPKLTLATGTNHDQNMSGTWENLPIYDADGTTKITYVVQEEAIAGYSPTITPVQLTLNAEGNNVAVTNAYTPGVTSVKVTKNWDDSNNQSGLRPSSVTVTLKANGGEAADANGGLVPVATLNEQGSWTYTWNNLPAMKDGAVIAYTVEETPLDASLGYNAPVITGCADKGFTITNTRPTTYVDVTGSKIWDDNNNQDGLRPNFVTFQLYKQIGNGEKQAVPGTQLIITGLDTQNTWTGTLRNLLHYEQGQVVTYSFDEVSTPSGYTKSVSTDGLTITNTHTDAKGTVQVVKYWDDNSNQDGKRPSDADFVAALKLYADGTEVTGVTPTVSTSGNNTTVTWTNLPVYGGSGTKVKYSVTEDAIADYRFVSNSAPNGVELTQGGTATINLRNHHDTGTKSVHFTKIWNDASNQDGTRPSEEAFLDAVKLYDQYGREITRTGVDKVIDTTSNPDRWTVTWDGLAVNIPEGEHAGEEAIYHAVETVTFDGYSAGVIDNSQSTHPDATDGVYDGGTITNTHTTATVTVNGTKTWAGDADNAYSTRPQNITIMLKDGDTTVDTATVTPDTTTGEWTYSFDNLPEYRNGELINYTVEETHVNGYATEYPAPTFDNDENVWTADVTNTLETTSISGIKIWNDDNDAKGLRPTSIMLDIKNNGTTVKTVEVNGTNASADGNGWRYEVTGLPKYNADGSSATYTVEEQDVPEYTDTTVFGTNVINTLKTHDITGTKVWMDGGKVHDNTTEVTLAVYRGTGTPADVEWESDPLSASRYHIDWSGSAYTISGLADQDKDGNTFFYKVVETNTPTGYAKSYDNTGATIASLSDGASSGGKIVNTLQQADQTIDLVGEKTITGREFKDGDSFTFNVQAAAGTPMPKKDGTETTSVTITPTSGTTATVDFGAITIPESAITEQGVTYTYTISEQSGSITGITYDRNADTITVNAKRVDGVIELKITDASGAELTSSPYFSFTNTYKASPVETSDNANNTIGVSKVLKGRAWKSTDSFTFKLEAVTEGAPMPTQDTVEVANENVARFGKMTFTEPGTYKYKLTEQSGSIQGITYSTETYYVAVIVTDNNDGTMSATTHYYTDEALKSEIVDATSVAFTNVYSITENDGVITAPVKATKQLDTRNFIDGDTFKFVVTAEDGTPMPSVTQVSPNLSTSEKSAEIDFGTVSYVLDDLGGEASKTFTYTIVETAGNQGGITYDEAYETLYIKVTDNGDGTMKAEYSTDGTNFVAASDSTWTWPVFENKYKATETVTPQVTKALMAGTLQADQFSFTIAPVVDGEVGDPIETVKNAADGTVAFSPLTFTQDDAGETFVYQIAEVDDGEDGVTYDEHTVTLTITVADNGDGTLTVTPTYDEDTTFTNIVADAETELTIAKVWDDDNDRDGIRPGSVDVTVVADDVETDTTITLSADNNWKDTVTGLRTYNEYGDPIVYSVTEDDVDGYEPTVTGTGTVADPFVITNKHVPETYGEPVDPDDPTPDPDNPTDPTDPNYKGIKATKIWNDGSADASNHPAVTFTLKGTISNGASFTYGDPQTIPAGAEGGALIVGWLGAPKKFQGEDVTYTIVEAPVEDYTAVVAQTSAEGETPAFTVTNSHVSTETTSFSGCKVWLDNNNALGIRPASITLNAKNGNDVVATETFTFTGEGDSTAASWRYTFNNLPKYDGSGNLISYTVEEVAVPNYTTSYINGRTVVNKLDSTTVTGTKVWVDGGQKHDNTTEITLEVWRSIDGGLTWEANAVDPSTYHVDWKGSAYTVTGLAPKDAENRTYTYGVTEKTVPNGYAVSYSDGASKKALEGGTITNTYNTGEVTLDLVAQKTLSGREFQSGDTFTFTVSSTDANTPMPAETSVTIEPTSGTTADVNFGTVTYTEPGTYTYTIAETVPADADKLPGVTYDGTADTLTVTVTRENGILTMTTSPEAAPYAEFANTYAMEPVVIDPDPEPTPDNPDPEPINPQAAITVVKALEGRDFVDGDEFQFAIEAVTPDAPMPDPATVTVSDATPASFGKMEFTAPGTYVYKLTEVPGNDTAITYSTEEFWAVIELTDNGDGTMSVERRYYKDANLKSQILGAESVTFTNVYGDDSSVVDAPIQAVKTLDTRDFVAGDKFTFAITAPNGTPMPTSQTVTIEPTEGRSYAIDFGTAHYTLADAGKTYTYTVAETAGNQGGITYEEEMATIQVKIVDNGNGTIHAEYSVNGGEFALATAEGFAWPELGNEYAASGSFTPAVKKTVTGAPLAAEQFEFELKDASGAVLQTAKNDGQGNVVFSAINYTLDDLANSPITYTISEKLPEGVTADEPVKDGITYDTHEVTLIVTLTDNGDGTVSATGAYDGNTTFNNKVAGSGTDVTVVKKWDDANDQDGIRPDSIEVTLTSNDRSITETATLTAESNWVYTFLDLPIYDGQGNEFTYTADEASVPDGYTKSISDDGLTITNKHVPETVGTEEPVDPSDPDGPTQKVVKATKVWDDNDDALGMRTDATLRLVGTVGGETVYMGEAKTVAADATGDALTVKWTGVPAKHNGQDISYTVAEDAIYGYVMRVSGDVTQGFTVTNTCDESTVQPDEIKVTKTWNDANDQDGLRPGSVTVKLIQKIGEGESAVIDDAYRTAELSADNEWTVTWDELPYEHIVDDVAQPITYSVSEVAVEGYTTQIIASSTPGEFTIVNTHKPETYGEPTDPSDPTPDPDNPSDPTDPNYKGIKATKVWADNEDAAGSRPGYAVFHLVGTVGDEVVYSASQVVYDNNLTVGWLGAPKNYNGEPISYTVTEDALDDFYTTSPADGDVTTGFTIVNTYNADYTIKAVKTWEGAEASPEEITLHLMKRVEGYEDTEVESATIPAGATGDELTVDFGSHPKVENGLPVTYYLVEDEVYGWQATMGEPEYDGNTMTLTVTNSEYIPPAGPAQQLVTYVDRLAAPGSQVLLFAEYPEGGTEPAAPADPNHEIDKYKFITWDKNVSTINDEHGNPATVLTTYVAQFQDLSKLEKTVTYINGQAPAGNQIVKSEKTNDPSSVTPPTETPAAENMAFTGWAGPLEDAAGNQVFVAQFAADCRNVPSKHCYIDPPVRKAIVGNPTVSPTFTFVLEAVTEGAPMPEGTTGTTKTMSFAGAGEVEFGWIEYTEAGTYEYKIYEESNNVPADWEYEKSEFGMKVTVTADEEGNLSATRVLTKDGVEVPGMTTATITNTYTGDGGTPTPTPTPTPKPKPDGGNATPKTGDATSFATMGALLGAGVIALVGAARTRKQR